MRVVPVQWVPNALAARNMFGPREPAQACGLRMNKAGGEVVATLEVVRAWHAVSRRVLRKDGE